jgi:hypothetical protein
MEVLLNRLNISTRLINVPMYWRSLHCQLQQLGRVRQHIVKLAPKALKLKFFKRSKAGTVSLQCIAQMTMELRLDISRDLAKKWREGCAVLPSASSKQVRT